MAKGILYVTTSEIEGLVKIGRTQNLPKRMAELSSEGYKCQHCNVVFAIEVDNYEEKENLLHTIFGKSRAGKTEFFAEDINLVIQTMSAFEGRKVFPEGETKEEIFNEVTEAINVKSGVLPVGEYTLSCKSRGTNDKCSGILVVDKDNNLILKKGALLGNVNQKAPMAWMKVRACLNVVDRVLQEDLICSSPSMAAAIVCGHNKNGWESWKDSNDNFIDIYRQEKTEDDE